VKYYIYVSDSKVDMLFPQVPHEIKKKIATEWKIDLKILSASRKSETEAEENRVVRLEAVTSFIQEYGNIGSIEEPADYIYGTLDMKWASLPAADVPVVYFIASTGNTYLCLAGSPKHMLGNLHGESGYVSSSATPLMVHHLAQCLESQDMSGGPLTDANLELLRKNNYGKAASFTGTQLALETVRRAVVELSGPEQQFEFLAKRLLEGQPPGDGTKKCLLLSPLYLALAS
jgi:hypothetical protein